MRPTHRSGWKTLLSITWTLGALSPASVDLAAAPQSPPSATGLLAHWRLDETSGTTARDRAGQRDGQVTSTGAVFVGGGVAGGALRLDRDQNGYVAVPHLPELVTNDFTVVAWARLAAGDTTPGTFLLTQHEAWHANGWLLLLNQSENVGWGEAGRASVAVNTGFDTLSSTSPINDGQWHQIALVYGRDTTTALYVDGAPAEASRPSVPMAGRGAPFLIGGLFGVAATGVIQGAYTGWVDDVQVYGRALPDDQLDRLFRNPGQNLDDLASPLSIAPPGGEFVGSITATLTTSIPGALIRYTLDGSEPSATSTAYQSPLTIRDTTTVKARLFVNDFPASEIVCATFTELPPVMFQPAGGLFTNSIPVSIVNQLGVGSLYYTLDGSDPTVGSVLYAGPVTVTAATTLKARVFVGTFPVSEVRTATFARVYALDDGIPPEWRERYFGPGYLTDPRVAAEADPDSDGWTNRLEYDGDSDPTSPNSYPVVTAAIRAIPLVSWNSIPGLKYRVLRKPRLNAPAWDVVLPAFEATESTSRYVDLEAPGTAVYLIELVRP